MGAHFPPRRLAAGLLPGISPRPKLNLASALPLGFTSEAEVLDAWLEKALPVDQVRNCLDESNPPGISIRQVVEVDERLPSLQSQLVAQDYLITLLEPLENLENKIQQVLGSENIIRVRRKKEYDLRPLIHGLSIIPPENQKITQLATRLSAVEGGTGRPEEVVAVLGGQPELARYHRTNLIFNIPIPNRRTSYSSKH